MDAAEQDLVLSQIQRELDAEVIYQNRKLQMGLAEIKERLKTTLPLSMNYRGNNQVFHLGDKTVELSGSPSDDQIVTALSGLPTVDFAPQPQASTKPMSITGLQSGAFKSMLEDLKKEIAAAQNQGVADVVAAKDAAKTEITNTIAGVKDKIKSEVSDALQEFAQFTNGGPA